MQRFAAASATVATPLGQS